MDLRTLRVKSFEHNSIDRSVRPQVTETERKWESTNSISVCFQPDAQSNHLVPKNKNVAHLQNDHAKLKLRRTT